MKQLLSIEYAKLKKFNSLRVILLVYAAIIPLWMFLFSLILDQIPIFKQILAQAGSVYAFPNVWNFTTWCASCFNILLGVAVVIITCNEIYFKTMRQNVIEGLTKGQVILSKFLVIFVLALLVTLYTALVAFLFGGFYSGFSGAFVNFDYVLVYFLQTLGYFSVAFLLASIIRKPALSIILFICIFPAEWISSLFVPDDVSGFMPLRSMSRLTPIPFENVAAAMESKKRSVEIWIMPVWMYVCVASAYIALFFSLTYYMLRKRDL